MSKKTPGKATQKLKVLYQNLGGVWYAFTAVNDDVFFGKVSLKSSAAGTHEASKAKAKRKKLPLDA